MACYRTTVAMATLREVEHVRQGAGEPARRWFSSERPGLIVGLDPAGGPIGIAKKTSPVLVRDGAFDLDRVRREFGAARTRLPADIMIFIAHTLARHPGAPSISGPA
jgi:hypothetical protein